MNRILRRSLFSGLPIVMMFSAYGQPQPILHVDPSTHLVTNDTVVELDSMKATQLFDKTKSWFVEYFRDAKEVVRGEVKSEMIKGTFIGKYDVSELESDILVRFKDGKIKIIIDRFIDAKPNSITGERLTIESYGVKSDKITLRSTKQLSAVELGCNKMIDNLVTYLKKKNDF